MSQNKGIMLVISGPAGSGKGTVCKHLLELDDYAFSISATTRAPRPGEVNGEHYHFISKEDFLKRIKNGGMIEFTEYCGNFYGTPKKEAEEVLKSGRNLLLEIEVEGARNIKEKYRDAVLILLLPPSYEVQEQRLRSRGTEKEEKILERLQRAKEEIKFAPIYDYVVYNYDGKDKEAADQIAAIVTAEKALVKRNPNIVKNFLNNK